MKVIVKHLKILLTIALFAVQATSSIINAQTKDLLAKYYSIQDGLSDDNITCIIQDSKGFIWFGTRKVGVSKFDGYTFTVYKNDRRDPYSISDNSINKIIEGNDGFIWVATQGSGVNRFDPNTEHFLRYKHNNKDEKSLPSNFVNGMYKDSEGQIWFGTNEGLCKYNAQENNFIRYKNSLNNGYHNIVYTICGANDSLLIIGTDEFGIYLFNKKTGLTVKHFMHNNANPQSLSNDRVISMLNTSQGQLLIGTRMNGLDILENLNSETFTHIVSTNNLNNSIETLFEDTKGNIWIGSKNGLHKLTHEDLNSNNPIVIYRNNISIQFNRQGFAVSSFFEDKVGDYWIGLRSAGVYHLKVTSKKFKLYNQTDILGDFDVTEFEDGGEGIWIETRTRGLNYFDKKTKTFTHCQVDPEHPNSPGNSDIRAIYLDNEGVLWIGTSNGLFLFNTEKNTFTYYLEGHRVNAVTSVNDDYFWIGTTCPGCDAQTSSRVNFLKFKKSDGSYVNYQHILDDNGSLPRIFTYSLLKDKNDGIWIRTFRGLYYYNSKKDTFTRYEYDEDDFNSLSDNYITTFCEDINGTIWIGTNNGLNKYNAEKDNFIVYSEHDGLPSNAISNVIGDDNGDLWISTNKGLSKIIFEETKSGEKLNITNFDIIDGVQGYVFGDNACMKDTNGDIYIGGQNGFNVFNPNNFQHNMNRPNVVITDFKLFNKNVEIGGDKSPLKKHISVTEELILNHKQSIISFGFVALNYVFPEKNQYKYIMEGFEDEWNDVGNRREAIYTNLPVGKYTFRVIASNNDGIWNEKGTSIKIIILPPWWETTLFRVLVLLFLIGIILGVYRYKLNDLHKQRVILEHKVNERTEELQVQKNQLQTIIENIPDPIYYKDRDSRFVVCNSALAKTFDVNYEDVIGKTDFDFHDEQDAQKYFNGEQELMRTGVSIMNLEEHNPYNENKKIKNIEWLLVTKVPLRDSFGNIIGMIGINRDITAQKTAQLEIMKQSEELTAQRDKLSEVNDVKDKLFSVVAHDLKNPFGNVLGLSELLTIKYDKYDEEKRKLIVSNIYKSSKVVFELITSLLNWARSQTGNIDPDFKTYNINDIIISNVKVANFQANDKEIEVLSHISEEEIPVTIDKDLINTVIRNLISNAIKFTPNGGKIVVSCTNKTHELIVSVKDSGVGISPDIIPKIFEVSSHYTTYGTNNEIGTGLGLTICYEFVKLHQGKIWVESEEGKGSTFSFSLPLKV